MISYYDNKLPIYREELVAWGRVKGIHLDDPNSSDVVLVLEPNSSKKEIEIFLDGARELEVYAGVVMLNDGSWLEVADDLMTEGYSWVHLELPKFGRF